jgi:DNA-binding CsgD family transcriptional regulator
LAEELRTVCPASLIVVMADEVGTSEELARLARARIQCHLLCHSLTPLHLEWHIRLAAADDTVMVSRAILDAFLASYDRLRRRDGGVRLPERERAVVARLAEGLSRKAIGIRLGIAPPTVSTLIGRAKQRLGVETDAELITAARRHGLLPSDERALHRDGAPGGAIAPGSSTGFSTGL